LTGHPGSSFLAGGRIIYVGLVAARNSGNHTGIWLHSLDILQVRRATGISGGGDFEIGKARIGLSSLGVILVHLPRHL
jgi:hypothetical protein